MLHTSHKTFHKWLHGALNFPSDIYLFKANTRNTSTMCEFSSDYQYTTEWRHWLWTDFTHYSGVSVIDFEQKKPFGGVLRERCSENMQQIYRRTPIPKFDFNKVARQSNFIEITLQHGCSPVNLLHMFRRRFYKNNSTGLLLFK